MELKNSEKGFTVIEVLMTSLVFSIIAITVSAIFVQIISLERRALAVQKIQDNALLVLEEMSRDIRVSRISDQESTDCTASSVTMTHPIKGTIVYQVSSGIIQRSTGGGGYVDVSGTNVDFSRMNFCIFGSLANDNQSPQITIVTSVKNRTGKEIMQINLQTTVTSRNYSDEFQNP